jgi:hypothetical protein
MRERGEHSMAVVLAVALLATEPVRANPAQDDGPSQLVARPITAVIDVQRAPGSEACPDSESVFRSLARLFPERAH